MGLIQRVIETAGIATISISSSCEITRKVRPPRALYPGFPIGHPLGYPHQVEQQLDTLRILLQSLKTIKTPGTLVKADLTGTSKTHLTHRPSNEKN